MKDNPPKESGHLDAEHYQRVGTNRKYHISYTSQLLQKAEIKIINDILIILFNKPELILIILIKCIIPKIQQLINILGFHKQ